MWRGGPDARLTLLVYVYGAPGNEEGTLVTLVSVGLLAIVIAYVVLRTWPERVNPPWGMSEFHRRMGREPPKKSVKLDQETTDRLT